MLAKVKALIPLSIKKVILKFLQESIRYLVELPDLQRNLVKVSQSEINIKIKHKIKRSLIKTFYFKKYDKINNIADIAGNNINFNYFMRIYHLFEEIFINQLYYFKTDNKKPFIIDCGSHIGMSVIYFKTIYPNAKIICFEPDDHTFSILQKNIKSNGLLNVETNNLAVMKFNGLTDFYSIENNKSDVAMSTIKERVKNANKKVVKATTLSKYIKNDVDLLKIDIEGAELSVLEELNKNNKLPFIKQMAIEYHHHIKEKEDNFSLILKILEDADFGYQIETSVPKPNIQYTFQDILIYAYNKTYNL